MPRVAGKEKSSMEPLSQWRENALARGPRYEQIIVSSIEVFARTNYEKATTAMLAGEAGVAEGTLYKYFPSKKELFLDCCRYVEAILLARYRAIYCEIPDRPLEYLKRIASSYQEFVNDNPSMRKFLAFVLNNTFDEDFRSELEGFMVLNVDATELMIRRAIEKGELKKKIDPRSAAWLFVGGYFTLILMAEIGAEEAREAGFAEGLLSAVLD